MENKENSFLKEQEKILRAKHLKLVLDKRRQGLKIALETSIAPLFDPNFEASGTHEVVLGGQEFMTCIKSEERMHQKTATVKRRMSATEKGRSGSWVSWKSSSSAVF